MCVEPLQCRSCDAAMIAEHLEANAWEPNEHGVRRLSRHLGFEGERVD